MTHKSTWANPDSLTIGFGPNVAERQETAVLRDKANVKVAKVQIDLVNTTFGASGAKVSLPASSIVKNVYAKVTEAHAGGTSLSFGDAGNAAGWILAASWANPVLGATIQGDGLYASTATEGQLPPKEYDAATDLFFTKTGTYTAGKANVYVEYV